MSTGAVTTHDIASAAPNLGYADYVQDFEIGVDSISLDYLGEQPGCSGGAAVTDYYDAGMIAFSLHAERGLTMRIRECSIVHQVEIDFAPMTGEQQNLLDLAGNGDDSAQRALLDILFA